MLSLIIAPTALQVSNRKRVAPPLIATSATGGSRCRPEVGEPLLAAHSASLVTLAQVLVEV